MCVCVFALQIAGYILYNLMHEMPFLPVSGRKLSEIIALPCTVTTADLMNKHVNRVHSLAIHRAREICYMDCCTGDETVQIAHYSILLIVFD